jgi:hypothetical protein
VKDHKLYHSVYSENPEAFTMSILRSTRYNPNSVYSTGAPRNLNADAFDVRPSMDSARGDNPLKGSGDGREDYRNSRYEDAHHEGDGSRAYPNEYEGYGDQQQYPSGGENHQYYEGGGGYGHGGQESYVGHSGGTYPFTTPGGGYVNHPAEAISRDPGQTPTANRYSDGQGVGYRPDGGLRRP